MSVICWIPYALLQHLQNDLDTLACTVHALQTQVINNDVLLTTFQATVNSMGFVFFHTEMPLTIVFLPIPVNVN